MEFLGGSTPLQRRRTSIGKELRELPHRLLVSRLFLYASFLLITSRKNLIGALLLVAFGIGDTLLLLTSSVLKQHTLPVKNTSSVSLARTRYYKVGPSVPLGQNLLVARLLGGTLPVVNYW